jgi:putative multiple sugar transport system permease protein
MSFLKDAKKILGGSSSGGGGRQAGMLIALVAIVILFQILTSGTTLSPENLINLTSRYSYILILAIGMVMVIIAGHIDLSVGSVAALTGIVVALSMRDWNFPWWAAILLGLVVGAIIGAWQGFWVAYVGIPAFIVTLAGMMLFRGMNQWIGRSTAVTVPEDYQWISDGYLPEVGPNTGYNNLTLLIGLVITLIVVIREVMNRRTNVKLGAEVAPIWVVVVRLALFGVVIMGAAMLFASGRVGTSIPASGLILGVLAVLYTFITKNTPFGRHVYAVGGNSRAASLSGVNIKRVNFFVMMNMSILAALAGMIFVARSNASGPQDGLNWELDAIASVFIGGAAVSGGIGTVAGALIGGLVMAVLSNGLVLLGVGSDQVQVIKGLVLLAAVAFDVYNKNRGRFSLIGLLTKKPANTGDDQPTGASTEAQKPQPAGNAG